MLLLPVPGAPVMPIICACPVNGYSVAASALDGFSMMRVISRVSSRRLARTASTSGGRLSTVAFLSIGTATRYLANMLHNFFHAGAGAKNSADAHFFERGNIIVRHNAADHQFYIVHPVGAHQLEDARRERHVRPAQNAQADHVYVLLQCRFDDHLRRL